MSSREGSTGQTDITLMIHLANSETTRITKEGGHHRKMSNQPGQTQDKYRGGQNSMQNQKKFPSPSNQNQKNKDGSWGKNKTPTQEISGKNSPAPNRTAPVSTPRFTPSKDGDGQKKSVGSGGRSRLFIGNITEDTTEEQMRTILETYGKITELYVNGKRGFAFVKFETKVNADCAKDALDGSKLNNKILRARYAAHGAALKVKNLSPHVTNELLEQAFGNFGVVERCIHIVDERGRPIGEGIVEFQRKHSSQIALKKCQDGCFLLGSFPKPVIVEPLEQNDEDDGHQEKNVIKNQRYHRELEKGPRFVPKGTFDYDFAMRWKELFEVEKKQREQLELDIQEQRAKLEEQMDLAMYDQETQQLRDQLRMREEEASMLMRDHEMRREDIRRRSEQQRHREDMMYQQTQEDRMRQGNNMPMEEIRRRQDAMMIPQHDMRQSQRIGNVSKGNTPLRGNDSRGSYNNGSGASDPNPGNSPHMQTMAVPLVGAPVPPLDLLNVGVSSSPHASRFDQPGGMSVSDNRQVEAGRSPMDRNESRIQPLVSSPMQGMGNAGSMPYKRANLTDTWEQDKRRRY